MIVFHCEELDHIRCDEWDCIMFCLMVKVHDKEEELKRLQSVLAAAVAQQEFDIAAHAKKQMCELQQVGV